jgi:hypothetical protein
MGQDYNADSQTLEVRFSCGCSSGVDEGLSYRRPSSEKKSILKGVVAAQTIGGAKVSVPVFEEYRYNPVFARKKDSSVEAAVIIESELDSHTDSSVECRLTMPPEKAKILINDITFLFIARPTSTTFMTNYYGPKWGSPSALTIKEHYVFSDLYEIWVYDFKTGDILCRDIKLKNEGYKSE